MAGAEVANARVRLSVDRRAFDRQWKRAERDMHRQAKQIGRSFALAGTAAAAGLTIAGVASVKLAVDFDRSMRNVNSIAKLSEKQFKTLSAEVLKLAGPTGQAPKTLAEGLYDIVSSGFKASDAVKILAVTAKAASAGMTDTATSTKAVAAALNAYHQPASKARAVSDILFETVNRGVLTFEELAQNMGDLVPASAPLGISLEEVGAAIATITLQGVPAAEAATRVKNTMLQLAKPSKDLKGLLHDQGYESGQAAVKALGFAGVLEMLNKATRGNVGETAKLTPEIRALLGVVGLTGKNLSTYNRNVEAMKDAQKGAGSSARAFAEQGKSIGVQWDKAKASLAAAAIPVGELLFPLLEDGAGLVARFAESVTTNMGSVRAALEGFTLGATTTLGGFKSVAETVLAVLPDLGSASDDTRNKMALLAPALGTVVVGLVAYRGAALAASVATVGLTRAISANPVGLFVAGVATLVAGAGLFGSTLDSIRSDADSQKDGWDRAADAARGYGAALQGLKSKTDRKRDLELQAQSAELSIKEAIAARESVSARLAEQGLTQKQIKGSTEFKRAQLGVVQSYVQLDKVRGDLKATSRGLAIDEETRAKNIKNWRTELDGLIQSHRKGQGPFSGYKNFAADDSDADKAKRVEAFADSAEDLAKKIGDGNPKLRRFADLAAILARRIKDIPSRKDVEIFYKEIHSSDRIEDQRSKRARGGYIHGAGSGDTVPAMLEPGEGVINRNAVSALGGAAAINAINREWPRFAKGGVAGKKPKKIDDLPSLPGAIELAQARAALTKPTADDLRALRREEKFWRKQSKRPRLTQKARAEALRNLKFTLDEIASLLESSAPETPDVLPGLSASAFTAAFTGFLGEFGSNIFSRGAGGNLGFGSVPLAGGPQTKPGRSVTNNFYFYKPPDDAFAIMRTADAAARTAF